MAKSPQAGATARRANPGTRAIQNLGMRSKIMAIVVVFAVFTALATAVALFSIQAESSNVSTAQHLQAEVAFPIGVVHQEELKSRMLIALYAGMPTDTATQRQEWVDKISGTDADLDAAAAAYEEGIASLGPSAATLGGENWQSFKTAWVEWKSIRDDKMKEAAAETDQVAFRAAFDEAQGALDTAVNSLEAEEGLVAAVAEELAATAAEEATIAEVATLGTVVVGLVLVVLFSLVVAAIMRGQVSRVRSVADALAQGDFTVNSGVESKDELGQMGRALDSAMERLRETLSGVAGSADQVAGASRVLADANAQMSSGSAEVSSRAIVVSTAAGEISRNLAGVSTSSEEMTASIREIAHSTSEAARVGVQAVEAASDASEKIGRLGASSQEIGNVVKVITSIAEQTNLLALNATIEAARAGEAGKGFAVVAGEVGELARETARATEDIAKRVEAIQDDAQSVVTVIAQITDVVQRINEFQSTIASAIEEQTATTNEMVRNVADAASGSHEIANGIEGVATAAAQSSSVAENVALSVDELSTLSQELRDRVASFTY